MYAEDCPRIADFALKSPQNFFRVGAFVQATISQHFEQVPRLMRGLDRDGLECGGFTRNGKNALAALTSEQERLHAMLPFWRESLDGECCVLRELVQLPGFGIVKAGFFAQLLLPWGDIGCLDRHNLRLYGLAENAFARIPASAEGLDKKIRVYLEVCQDLGGSEKLWDAWCHYMAALRPKSFPDAETVSKLHVQCIVR